jgi:dihydroflavonol-4-reductase
MTTLVTGATGFVGSAVARALLAQGRAVRVLARRGADPRNLDGLDVERIEGDLTDPAVWPVATRGISALYHVAADYRLWVRDPAAMYRANVDASVGLIRAAASAGANRIVYTSSVATLGLPRGGGEGDEETPVAETDMIGPYKHSKFKAEEAVRALVERERAPVVIVNPSTPIGPRDVKPTPTGRLIVEAANGRMPAYVETGLNLVHVDDVAAGHLLAEAHGQIGRRYVLGAENFTLRQILEQVAALTGGRPPLAKLPPALILPFAHAAEALARITSKEPFATVDGLKLASKMMFFSSRRAQAELGYTARPAVQALSDAIAWFRAAGLVKR